MSQPLSNRWIVSLLAGCVLLWLPVACAEPVVEAECPDPEAVSWDRSPCAQDSFYVMYERALPYRGTLDRLREGTALGLGAEIVDFCQYGSAVGWRGEYLGDELPAPGYFMLDLSVADSATARKAVALLLEQHFTSDTSFYDPGDDWLVVTTGSLTLDHIDSVRASLQTAGIVVEYDEMRDDNALVFFGTCLGRPVADSLAAELTGQGVSVRVVTLAYPEADI